MFLIANMSDKYGKKIIGYSVWGTFKDIKWHQNNTNKVTHKKVFTLEAGTNKSHDRSGQHAGWPSLNHREEETFGCISKQFTISISWSYLLCDK